MPDTRSHRGPDPRDARAFAPEAVPALRAAAADLSWLLGRSYPTVAALKVVGDRYALTERQRAAVLRSACPDAALARRLCRRVEPDEASAEPLTLDGFNVLTTVEAALGGAVVLVGRDGCLRDIAGVHGTYRKVEETAPALALVGDALERLGAGPCRWLLDRPVSNSGRLRAALLTAAAERGWDWQVDLVDDPDRLLIATDGLVATADSVILDRGRRWLNLARLVVASGVPGARVVDLSAGAGGG